MIGLKLTSTKKSFSIILIFWYVVFSSRIQHSNFEGNDLQTLSGHSITHPFGIAIYKGKYTDTVFSLSRFLTGW